MGLLLTTEVRETQHPCAGRLSALLYSAADSQSRELCQAGQTIESDTDTDTDTWNSTLSTQEIKEEPPIDDKMFALDHCGHKAEWAHIKEPAEQPTDSPFPFTGVRWEGW